MTAKGDPFARSGQTRRSPPPESQHTSVEVDPTKKSCKFCDEFDNLDMVECEECCGWFHFKCVNVTREIETTNWSCAICNHRSKSNQNSTETIEDDNKSQQSRSASSTSSIRRAQLALEKIEEERRMRESRENDYLTQKYKILDQMAGSDGDVKEPDPELRSNTSKATIQWVMDQTINGQNRLIMADNRARGAIPTRNNGFLGPCGNLESQSIITSTSPVYQDINRSVESTAADMMYDRPVSQTQTGSQACLFGNLFTSSTNIAIPSVKENFIQTPRTLASIVTSKISQPVITTNWQENIQHTQPVSSQSNVHNQFGGPWSSIYHHHSTGNHQSTGHNQSTGPRISLPVSSQSIVHNQFGVPWSSNYHHHSTGNHQSTGHNQSTGPRITLPVSSQSTGHYQYAGYNQYTGPGQSSSHHQSSGHPQSTGNQNTGYQQSHSAHSAPHVGLMPDFTQYASRILTPSQIAARQVVPKKLPDFYGEVEKFPKFIRAYENSTDQCGFTNGENLSRLSDSLKGVAFEAVGEQLLYPDSVPHVIESLKVMFGRPEFIIESLLQKISKEAAPKADDLSSLVKFSISVQNLCGTIQISGSRDYLQNPTLMKALVDKLPPSIQLNWACHKQNVVHPNLVTLGEFLQNLAKLASSIVGPPKVKRTSESKNSESKKDKSNGYINAHVESDSQMKSIVGIASREDKKCPACCDSSCQKLKNCKKFNELDTKTRWSLVRENQLCFRCFGRHRFNRCKSKQKCNTRNCQKAHHPLLHEDDSNLVSKPNPYSKSTNKSTTFKSTEGNLNTICSKQSINKRNIDIFRIVPVFLYHNGRSIRTFAYLDDGSNLTLMENSLANELDLDSSSQENLCINWSFGGIRRDELVSRRVSVRISGIYANAGRYDLHNVRTVEELDLPSQSLSQKWLDSYQHFKGIPISSYESGAPRMLIGLQYSKLMVSRRTVEGEWSEPIACKTRLGWVVQGPDGDDTMRRFEANYSMNMCECQHTDNQLHFMVKEFFSLDSFGVKITDKLLESKEMQRSRQILESTTVKIKDRYETGLLWRYDNVELPDSYPMALKRLECLERKMKKDKKLAENMCKQIQDFQEKGYVRKLSPEELQQEHPRVFYLPIFPVFNPKKPEKFRIVWDAAAKVKNISLNTMLLTGPDQLSPLPDVLRRFRERRIAITGDIKEMYHQVHIRDADKHAQRFLWRNGNSNREPDVFVMEVMTFGATCSPSAAQFVKNKNALEYKDKFPRAFEAITDNHYIDDMLECSHTVEDAIRLTQEVKSIHQNAGFEIRNFTSNSFDVLKKLGESTSHQQKNLNIAIELNTERVLGMFWNTRTDNFTYSLKFTKLNDDVLKGRRRPTKREVLRAIMSIFDPLGLMAQFLVYGKILLQKIWREGLDWDEQLSDSLYEHWLTWIKILPKIEEIEIPRLYSSKLSPGTPKSVQLHIFVDASIEACAGLAYYRIEDEDGVDCCLIGAKTRVAPNKPLTIPRLELQGAVLGLRLCDSIEKSQRIQVAKRFFWSDSQTVLSWINSEARKYHQFVAFRIGEILESSSTSEWHWVDTNNNVADEGTKWKNNPDFSSSSRWYKGSSFLYQPEREWNNNVDESQFTTEEEMRSLYVLSHLELPKNDLVDPKNFSNWRRLRRALAYALRFIDILKLGKKNKKIGPLTREEYIRSQNILFQQAQRDEFMEEIVTIRNNESLPIGEKKELHKSSVLRTCSPYLDEFETLRIRGRIDAASSLTLRTKRPIILPRFHYITKLVVLSYHQKYHHVNHQTTLIAISQTFYIPALRVVLKSVIQNQCQRCKNDKATPAVPEMAELPPARLATFIPAFTYVGIDYFGPMKVKVKRSVEPRWGVLITCLTTRAVHIEIAHSLDTSSCIMSIRNFMNIRRTPVEIYSDNGTNFHSSEKELRKEFAKLNQSRIEDYFTDEKTQWTFNPPTGAHMGGVWERLIRSIKSVLKKSMPTRTPTHEMLNSFLQEAANILNSRPLTYVQLDNIDDEVLTPNHILSGYANNTKSPGQFDHNNLLRDDWKAVQEMANRFWRKFNVEYLPTLTRRTKWFKDIKPLEVGDVVIVVDDENERNTWPKGIVEEVFVGKANKVRQARVRMIRGKKENLVKLDVKKIKHQTLLRPAAKLAVLDVKGTRLSSSQEAVNGRGNVVNAPSSAGQMESTSKRQNDLTN